MHGLAIACLNSLLVHVDQLRIFLSIHKIDILTVNEKKLDFSISSNEIHISGYDVVRRDRCDNGRHGGGSEFEKIFLKLTLNFLLLKFVNLIQGRSWLRPGIDLQTPHYLLFLPFKM